MGPTWGPSGPTGPRWAHVGPINVAIWIHLHWPPQNEIYHGMFHTFYSICNALFCDGYRSLVQIMACRLFGAKPLSEPMVAIRTPSQYPKRRLFVRSRKVSKPRDWYFKLSYRFEIWQAHRQHCCRSACQISERSDNSKYKSRGFETLRDLTERRLFGYWDGAQILMDSRDVFTHSFRGYLIII